MENLYVKKKKKKRFDSAAPACLLRRSEQLGPECCQSIKREASKTLGQKRAFAAFFVASYRGLGDFFLGFIVGEVGLGRGFLFDP